MLKLFPKGVFVRAKEDLAQQVSRSLLELTMEDAVEVDSSEGMW
jgi:hypothetical protein